MYEQKISKLSMVARHSLLLPQNTSNSPSGQNFQSKLGGSAVQLRAVLLTH